MSCPTQENLSLARQVIKYIIGSLDLKITYRPMTPIIHSLKQTMSLWGLRILIGPLLSMLGVVMGASWSCLQEQFTQISYALISGGWVSWSVRRMPRAGRHLWNLEGFLRRRVALHPDTNRQSGLYCHSHKPAFSKKQKHIPIRVCYLRECCSNKMVELRPVGTRFEVADFGTKVLPQPAFVMLCNELLGITTFSEPQDV